MKINNYATTYVKNALNCPEISIPDRAKSEDLYEVLISLYQCHLAGGVEAAKQTWNKLIELRPELAQLINRSPHRRLIPVNELKNLPPVEWITPGMLPKRSLCEVHGAPGSGKSLFVLHQALIIAQEYRIVYVAAEGVSGCKARVEAWEKQYGLEANLNLNFYRDNVNLLDDRDVTDFIALIEVFQPEVIIFDTLARCMIGGDENSAKDMGLAIAACDKIRNAVDATVLIVHHTGKTGSTERGSSALRGGCDSMIELINQDGTIIVSSSKLKDGKPFDTLYFTMMEHGESVALVPTTRSSKQATKPNTLNDNDRKILELLNMEIYVEHGANYKRISDSTSITGSTLDRALSRLKANGYMSQSKKGDPYFITVQGKKALAT